MALASLLLATVLFAQSPVKLTHTYVKDQKVTYTLSLKDDSQGIEVAGDVTFTATDEKGAHAVSSPSMKVSKDGNELATTDLSSDKIVLDAKGIAANYEFNERGIGLIIPTICGFLPDKEVEPKALFDIKEKRDNYTLEGNGKLLEITEKDGTKLATIEYTLEVKPGDEQPAILKVKSVIDMKTGQLVSSSGTIDIENRTNQISVKRK